jgi:PAS domain S-box-containing protein
MDQRAAGWSAPTRGRRLVQPARCGTAQRAFCTMTALSVALSAPLLYTPRSEAVVVTLDWLTTALLLIAALTLFGGARRWVQSGGGFGWQTALTVLGGPAQTEAALRDSAERLRATFEQAAVGIAHVAPDGRWLRVNQKLCDITGYRHEELLAGRFQDITHPDDLDADLRYVERLLAGDIPTYALEKRYIRRDGEVVWINLTVSLVREAHGAPRYFISVIEDISERKRTERALRDSEEAVRRLNAELAQRVRDVTERTIQVEAANRELEAFSYSVSHDLRAPLRAIDGFSQALLEELWPQLEPINRAYLQRVRDATHRMGELIDGLLSLSRLTRSEMHISQVDLSALATEVAASLRRTQPEREVTLIVAPGLVARGDASLLRVLFDNLLGNAWKYTAHRQRPHVEVGATRVAAGTAYFVRDDGAGFDMAYADKLFRAFQRLHTVDEFPGSGIGLATVQRIVHRHGGAVWADAAVDEGATFYFTLPG